MAGRGISRERLAEIRQGFKEVKQKIADATKSGNLRGLVRDLRRIPSADRDKKRELAAFFQDSGGREYSRDERRQAYDDVLGRERNSRQRG